MDISYDQQTCQGKAVQVFQDGNDLSKYGLSAEPRNFFVCEGNIKNLFLS